MDHEQEVRPEVQQLEFAKHLLVCELLRQAERWQRSYCALVRAMADAFGEELVFDAVERVWWDMAFEVGLTWREKFEQSAQSAMKEKAASWHDQALWARICCCDVTLGEDRWELRAVKCYREVFNQMNEPEIGISWCMTDFAAVRGWGPSIVMRQPKQLLRGDNYCHQIRFISEDSSLQWNYSKELSERVGWRSVKRLRYAKEGSDGHSEWNLEGTSSSRTDP